MASRFALLAALLVAADCAHAQLGYRATPGPHRINSAALNGIPVSVESFGALTPAGYGGTNAGISGTLTILSEGSPCTGNANTGGTFIVDANNQIVPNNAALTYTGLTTAAAGYGTASAIASLGNSMCVLRLTNGLGEHRLNLSIQSNAYTVTPLTGTTINPDGANGLGQLGVALGSGVTTGTTPCGTTIIGRDGAYNPASSAYATLTWPGAFDSSCASSTNVSNPIIVTSEHPATSATDVYGINTYGGGLHIGALKIQNHSATDIVSPVAFNYVNFDAPTAAGAAITRRGSISWLTLPPSTMST
jgi:hypothetical protein